jgi:hypothetical protein
MDFSNFTSFAGKLMEVMKDLMLSILLVPKKPIFY